MDVEILRKLIGLLNAGFYTPDGEAAVADLIEQAGITETQVKRAIALLGAA
jgi:hypothetical protein